MLTQCSVCLTYKHFILPPQPPQESTMLYNIILYIYSTHKVILYIYTQCYTLYIHTMLNFIYTHVQYIWQRITGSSAGLRLDEEHDDHVLFTVKRVEAAPLSSL